MCALLSVLFLIATLSGCDDKNDQKAQNATVSNPVNADFSKNDSDMFTDRDTRTDYDPSNSVTVTLQGHTAKADGNGVDIHDDTVTITREGTYILEGALADGQVVVNADENAKVHLILQGANIYSGTSAALYILSADKVFITLAENTENTLSNGGGFTAGGEDNIDGAVYSKQDLTFNGNGSLTVTSPAGHGIVCKDDLVFAGGTYSIVSAAHGLDANDSIRITDAEITVDAGKDGIHAGNAEDATKGFIYISGGKLTVEAEGDGLSSGYYTQIADGILHLLCGGGYQNGTKENSGGYGDFMGGHRPGGGGGNTASTQTDSASMKGIKSGSGIQINGGSFTVDSADDAVHAASDLIINGGNWKIASGDDGFHSDTALTVTAGSFVISQCYEGLEAEKICIKGGEFEIHASDDGLNAAGGTDASGEGGRDEMFGGGRPGGGRPGGGMGANPNAGIEIGGGSLKIYSGGDCLDSNGALRISGGYVYATNPTGGDVSVLDSDQMPVITGGTFVGIGISTMMAESFGGESTQGVIACSCGTQAAGSSLTIKNSGGTEVLSLTTEYKTVLLIISTPEIVSGESYNISIGEVSGTIIAD
jgi:hypothetical protein